MAPLEGIRIIEFGHYIAVPAAGQILADLGADVIKVEAPEGDQARTIGTFGDGIVRAFNRGKRSVVLDLRDPDGQRAALDLVDGADVVLQNLRHGTMEKFGLGVQELREAQPRLVHVSVSGFHPDTPSANRAGLDIAAQAESGLMSITGEACRDPQRVGFPVIDSAASYAVVQAVMTGLFQRERTGTGSAAHVSLLDVAIHLQSSMWGEWSATGTPPQRKGNGQATVAPAADVFETVDGTVVLSAYTPSRFRSLCTVIGRPELVCDDRFIDNPRRVAHRQELLREIGATLSTWTTEECLERLTSQGVVVAQVRDYGDLPEAADVCTSGILVSGLDEEGTSYLIPGLPFSLQGHTAPSGRGVPRLGEHNDSVLVPDSM